VTDQTRPARIVLVTAQTTGGIGRHVASLLPELLARGAKVEVAAPRATGGLGAEAAGTPFWPVEIPRLPSPVPAVSALRELKRALDGADLVHAHGVRAGLAAGAAARSDAVPHLVVTIHNAVFESGSTRRSAEAVAHRMLALLAELRICVSEDLARAARAAAPAKAGSVITMPVGADPTPVKRAEAVAAREQLGLEPGRRLVVGVGRLDPQKGFDVLVEATARMDGAAPPLVVICGEGPARSDLEHRIHDLDLAGRVRLLGNRKDAKALTAAADAFCMPSRWEGSPLALHEALAAGRPVVAAAVGGIPELLTFGQAGLLVPPEDPVALAAALSRVLSDQSLADHLGAQALEAAAAWPDAETTARRVADLYEEVLGRPLGGSKREE
jgi:glycosyltransferase involved in cell wall biosynthesis